MAKRNKAIKCKACGTILSSKDRLKRVLSESDKALERYYNKHIRKKK